MKCESVCEFSAERILGVAALEFRNRALEHGFTDDQLADKIHDDVDSVRIHAQRVFCRRMSQAGGGRGGRFVMFLFFRWKRRKGWHAGLDTGRNGGCLRFEKNFQKIARRTLRRRYFVNGNLRDDGRNVAMLANPIGRLCTR